MSAELREKLAAAIEAAKYDEDDYVDSDCLSRAMLVVVESAIKSELQAALAVRTEVAAQLAADWLNPVHHLDLSKEEITPHICEDIAEGIRSLSTESEKAWLAQHDDAIAKLRSQIEGWELADKTMQVICADREREIAELRSLMPCGHPKACWKPDPGIIVPLQGNVVTEYYTGYCTACREIAELCVTAQNRTDSDRG